VRRTPPSPARDQRADLPSTVSQWETVEAVERAHVTPRELFFDLVFVFAFTQVLLLLGRDPTITGIFHGVLVLAALWWAWVLYASLTNTVNPEDELVGAALLIALVATFVAALAVPGVFDNEGALFGAAFLVVCATHITLYAIVARENPDLLGAVLRLAPWTLLAATLILIAGFTGGARTGLWVAALAAAYVGAALSGSTGWQLHPSHLAERYGLVLIIALGEAFISIGSGATGHAVGLEEIAAAVLGVLVATAFWLAYFDFFSLRGAQILRQLQGADRASFARDAYVYAHFPMIVGIVLFAFAMKNILANVGEQLDPTVAFALYGGSACYLLTFSTIRTRFVHRLSLSRGRFVAALVLLALLPLATSVQAVAALAVVTAVWLALHAYEFVRWRDARAESRSVLASVQRLRGLPDLSRPTPRSEPAPGRNAR
jgi:low temperature requirement protein LtrA